MGEFFTICCIILRAGHATTLTRCNVCDHVFRPNYDCICRGRRHYGLNVFFILLKEAFLPSLKIKQFVVFVSFSLFFFGGKHHYSDRHKNIGQLSSLWSVVLSHQVFPSKFLFNSFRFIFLFRIQTIKFGQDGIRSAEFWCRPLHPLCPNHSHKVSRKILEKQST